MIKNIPYEFKRLYRFQQIAGALLHKPNSYFKHFTFITKATKIYSIGWNDTQASSARINGKLIIYPLDGVHAEADAISNLDDLDICRKATLINIRLNNRKELRNSKPCDVCFKLIQDMGFKKVYYSTNFGFDMLRL